VAALRAAVAEAEKEAKVRDQSSRERIISSVEGYKTLATYTEAGHL
jgi:hypothetical protein